MLKHWPFTDTHKQILYLNQIHAILFTISANFFPPICKALSSKLFYSLRSSCYKVSLSALNILNDENFLQMLISTLGYVPKMLMISLSLAIESWHSEVKKKAIETQEKIVALNSKKEELNKNDVQASWLLIATYASINYKKQDFSNFIENINKSKLNTVIMK